MALGEFTKEECDATLEAVDEIFKALTISKRREFLGHMNDVALFLRSAKKFAFDTSIEANAQLLSRADKD